MRKLSIPTRQFHIQLPEEEASRLELHLWSEAEQRIPYASRQRFIVERIREYFGRKGLDLGVYFQDLPPGSTVYGPPEYVERLQLALEDMILART